MVVTLSVLPTRELTISIRSCDLLTTGLGIVCLPRTYAEKGFDPFVMLSKCGGVPTYLL